MIGARPTLVGLALAAALTGCGESGPPTAPSLSASSGSTASPTTGGVEADPVAVTELGELPAPSTLAALQRRAVALPDTLGSAGRAAGPAEQIRYVDGPVEFGIDVSDAVDIAPGITTTAQAFERLRSLLDSPTVCAQPPSWCLRGASEGGPTVVWGHDDSPLLFAATSTEQAQLQVLLEAWSG